MADAGGFGQGAVKQLIERHEVGRLGGGRCLLMKQLGAQFANDFRAADFGHAPDDIGFDCFADEACFEDGFLGNPAHQRATLGADFDQAFFAQLDEGFADGLAAGGKQCGAFGLGQACAGLQLSMDDLLAQCRVDLGADGGRGVQPWSGMWECNAHGAGCLR